MGRAIIGRGTGYGGPPKVLLDGGDCGTCQPCATGPTKPAEGDGTLSAFPLLRISLRRRVGYDDDGVAMFDWIALAEGRSFVYEKRTELNAEAGVTTIRATMTMPNRQRIDFVPETAVVEEMNEHGQANVRWDIDSTAVLPDRIEIVAHRVWSEVPGPGPVFDPLADLDF